MKVLVLSRNYPNDVMPLLGLWTEGMVRHVADHCAVRVISPVPYCPPLPGPAGYTRFRQVPARELRRGIEVLHPRFLTGPGYWSHSFDASTYYLGVWREVEKLRRTFPFDLIHAHYGYPDGCVAARLGRAYGVPIIITEHAPWQPWMEQFPRVRAQAVRAAQQCAFHIAVSNYTRDTIARFTGESTKLCVIPNGVDASVFTPPLAERRPATNQLLYVGIMRHVKGVDILLRAMCRLIENRPDWRLKLVGGGFYRNYSREEEQLRRLAQNLGLSKHVEFVGMKPPHEVATYMRESAVLILPSRSETFGSVLIEALACGTPVVATRCGGPEEIINDQVGILAPKEDPEALAEAIAQAVDQHHQYDPARLRRYALENFAWERVAQRTFALYREALDRYRLDGKSR